MRNLSLPLVLLLMLTAAHSRKRIHPATGGSRCFLQETSSRTGT